MFSRGGAEYDALAAWLWEQLDKQAGIPKKIRLFDENADKPGLHMKEQVTLVFGQRAVGSIEALMVASFALGVAIRPFEPEPKEGG